MKPLVLIIRDGWGVCDEDAEAATRHGNAVRLAHLPVLDELLKAYPHCLLQASGEAVGLPPGQMGNSEVGHQNLGAGRVTYQDLMRISLAIRDGSFFRNPVLLKVMGEMRRTGKRLHLMGLLSDGGVHSHIQHLFALLEMARQQHLAAGQVSVHAFLDGRDTPPRSGLGYVELLEEALQRVGVGRIATVSGRYFSMDRDNRRERTRRAYDAYVSGHGRQATSALAAIRESYATDQGDEFVEPTVIVDDDKQPLGRVEDGDGLVFFNFRPDRARQITRAFTEGPLDVHLVCMTEYDATIRAPVAFPPALIANPLGEVVAQAGMRQLRIAETEKYAHVTYFFNGGREEAFTNEDRALIASLRIATYDLQPEMSAPGITDELLRRLTGAAEPYDLVVLNFANPDMVGHTGVLDATVAALEVVDACVGRIVDRVRELGGMTLITGDHGNAEQMLDDNGGPLTAHTLNPVHLIVVDDRHPDARLEPNGIFAAVAPTILGVLGLEVPSEMTGKNLLTYTRRNP
ncbi:MAG: 2,3-bisphosphoglycerate-independent phosphoglycerate mutase [Chloroflexota bacterium]|nr:2,3-bisphosphoglycerate-independent phosphoglycerate mutase [Chloroflexota bacterium]